MLRALDTVEDDMAIDSSVKLPILESFHQKIYDRHATLPKLSVNKSAKLLWLVHTTLMLYGHLFMFLSVCLNAGTSNTSVVTEHMSD